MAELEKVIKGLECCQKSTCPIENGCPYHLTTTSEGTCNHWMEKDALELLKEQQPRLLTLEEVKQAEVVWCEWGSVDGYVECMMFDKVDADGDYRLTEKIGCTVYYDPSEYNESWRCWSARPTDEQMKETEWEGEGE